MIKRFISSKSSSSCRSLIWTVGAVLDTDVVSHVAVAVRVVPEVVAVILEDWVPVFHVGHAVLAVEVIGLVVSPVEPLNAGIGMRPPPVSIDVVLVAILSYCSHPEEVAPGDTGLLLFVRGVEVEKHRLDPVVYPRVGDLHNPTTVAGTEDLSIHFAQLFHGEKVAVTTSSTTFMPKPSIRTVMSVLGRDGTEENEGSGYFFSMEQLSKMAFINLNRSKS